MHKLFSGSGRVICLRSVRPEKKKRKLNSINFGRVRILLRVHEEEQLVGSQMGLGWLGPRRLACCRDSVEVEWKMGSIATMSMRQLGKPKTEKISMCRVEEVDVEEEEEEAQGGACQSWCCVVRVAVWVVAAADVALRCHSSVLINSDLILCPIKCEKRLMLRTSVGGSTPLLGLGIGTQVPRSPGCSKSSRTCGARKREHWICHI